MTVYLRGSIYWFDFWFNGTRYNESTQQQLKVDAQAVEANRKRELRQEAGGIAAFDPQRTPRFSDWAEVYLAYQQQFTSRPDLAARTLRTILEFWGAKPTKPHPEPAVVRKQPQALAAPYHDLRIGDPIASPRWILTFNRWIAARGVSGSTRNTYMSTMSGLYRVALQPQYRAVARVGVNPFRDIRRSPTNHRVIALEPDQVLAWIREASYHVALAATIAALAPKLRLQTILDLQWATHVDRDLTRITVYKHKTAGRTGAPQVTPISVQLRAILLDAKKRHPGSTYVITYRDGPVQSIKNGVRRAARDAGLTWGVRDGVTFHTFRHSIATLLARLGLPERLRMELMGHSEIRTTQQYTHLSPDTQVDPHERLAEVLPLEAIVTGMRRPKSVAALLPAARPAQNVQRTRRGDGRGNM